MRVATNGGGGRVGCVRVATNNGEGMSCQWSTTNGAWDGVVSVATRGRGPIGVCQATN